MSTPHTLRIPTTRREKEKQELELSRVKYIENDLKGNENWLEFAGGLNSRESTFWSCVTSGARSKDRVLVI